MTTKLSRRDVNIALLGTVASTLVPEANGKRKAVHMLTPDRNYEFGNPLEEFNYGNVAFDRCLQQAQLEQTHEVIFSLDENALLRPFRHRAGLPAPGLELGGWYSSTDRDPGHAFGQWISALSRYYAITGEQSSREKVFRLVDGYAETVDSAEKFYKDYPSPSYIYEKLSCGLVDAHQFVRHPRSLSILAKATKKALPFLPDRPCVHVPERFNDCSGESYTIPENQLIAWQRGGDELHLEVAQRYLYNEFFDPLARGENVLAQKHAYSHVNSLCSAAKAYLVFGDEKYRRAAINGLNFVEEQSFATGGWGASGENFLPLPAYDVPERGFHMPPLNTLSDTLAHAQTHFETPCGSYAHFKLTRYLLRITKEPRYGDSMERVMYNTVLGALPLMKHGKAFYQSNYHNHARKMYFDGYDNIMEDRWPCCSGTLPQLAADYRISTYFRDAESVYVNLFIPSRLQFEFGGTQLSLKQSGSYPLTDTVLFEVAASRPTRFALRFRVPGWAKNPSIRINSQMLQQQIRPGTFASISRRWRAGDRIELTLPRELELKAVDSQHPDTVAVVYGPLVLFAVCDDTPKVTRQQLLAAKQQGAGAAEWRADTSSGPLSLLPFWAVKDQLYFTYLSV